MRPARTRVVGRRAGVVAAAGRSAAGGGSAPCGRLLIERSVRAVAVVVLDVFLQHQREVASSGDQEVVEAFAAQGADPALGDRVGARCSNRAADDADVGAGEHGVDGGGELGIAVADQEPKSAGVVAEVHEEVAGLLGDPGSGGVCGDPGEVHAAGAVLDHDEDVEAAEEDGVDVGEVDREDRVGLRCQELSPGRPWTAAGRGRCPRPSRSSRRWRRRAGGRVRPARRGCVGNPI